MTRTHLTPSKIAAVALGSALVTSAGVPARANAAPVTTTTSVAAVAQPAGTAMDPALIQVNARPPIPFHPFTMVDKSGRPIDPDTLITLHNGKRVTAGDYYAEMNRLERGFNADGYSLRDPAQVTLQQTRLDTAALQAQASDIVAMHTPSDGKTSLMPPSAQELQARHVQLLVQDAARLQRLNQAAAAPARVAAVRLGGTAPVNRLVGSSFSQSKSYDYHIGDPSTLYASVNGREDLTGSKSQTTLSAEAKASGSIFSYGFDLVDANGSLSAQRSGPMAAQLKLNVIGFGDILNLNQSANASWSKSDTLTEPLDVHTTEYFMLGPIPIGVTIGARGAANLYYDLELHPASVSATIEPGVQADIYAEAGVDIGIASAGAGGSVTLMRGGVKLTGDCTLDSDTKGLYIDADCECDDIFQALNGKLYVYADVDVDLGFWSYTKRWEDDLYSWDGISTSGTLFKEHERFYL